MTCDIIFKKGNFSTTKRWTETKAGQLGEPTSWRIMRRLATRVMHILQLNKDMDDEDDEWENVNPEFIAKLDLITATVRMGDHKDDYFWLQEPTNLFQFKRETFHKKVGKLLPDLIGFTNAFQKGIDLYVQDDGKKSLL